MGAADGSLLNIAGTCASIFAVGLLCGYAAERGNSVIGAVIVHFMNNLTLLA